MSDKPKKIIRGASIEGLTFCPPTVQSDTDQGLESSIEPVPLHKFPKKHFISEYYNATDIEKIWNEGLTKGYQAGLKNGQEQGYEAGKEEGVKKGIHEGTNKARTEWEKALFVLNSAVNDFAQKKEELYEKSRPELIKFCLAVCERVFQKELSQPQNFVELIENLLEQGKGILKDSKVIIYLSPEDLKLLNQHLNKVRYDKDFFEKLDFISDPSINSGSCRIETSLGLINFDSKRLLSTLEEKILGTSHDINVKS